MTCLLQKIDGTTQQCWTRPDKATGYYKASWKSGWKEHEAQAIKVSDGYYEEIPGSVVSKPIVLTQGQIYAREQRRKARLNKAL